MKIVNLVLTLSLLLAGCASAPMSVTDKANPQNARECAIYGTKPKTYVHYKPVKGTLAIIKKYKGKPFGTYDINTGETKAYKGGYCFSFHQNEPDEDGNFKSSYGRYTAEEYDNLTNDIAEKYDLPINVGVYGNPEISFYTEDKTLALEMAKKYNQQSVYDCAADDIIKTPAAFYDKTQNPMPPDNYEGD